MSGREPDWGSLKHFAQALGADFQFDFGEDGSETALMFPIDQDCGDEPKSAGRAATDAAHFLWFSPVGR
jgi:hypothetical protein